MSYWFKYTYLYIADADRKTLNAQDMKQGFT
jgi:histone H3/H4